MQPWQCLANFVKDRAFGAATGMTFHLELYTMARPRALLFAELAQLMTKMGASLVTRSSYQ